ADRSDRSVPSASAAPLNCDSPRVHSSASLLIRKFLCQTAARKRLLSSGTARVATLTKQFGATILRWAPDNRKITIEKTAPALAKRRTKRVSLPRLTKGGYRGVPARQDPRPRRPES